MEGFPRGLVGATLGALGSLALLPIAAAVATHLSSPPTLPGAERAAQDIKAATYAEGVVLLAVLPLAALLFGRILPRVFESRLPAGRLSFEWAAAGFACSFFLARRGLAPAQALAVGSGAFAGLAAGIAEFRRSFRFRRFFAGRGRRAIAVLMLAGASVGLARRAGFAPARSVLADLLGETVLAAVATPVLIGLICLLVFRRPVDAFDRAGRAAWLSIAAAAGSLAWPRASGLLVPVALALPVLAPFLPGLPRGSAVMKRFALGALILVCAWRVVHSPVIRTDVFEDGVSLFATQIFSHGGRPYIDVVPVHGWGADGGVDAVSFRLFGASLRTFYLRHSVWAAAALIFLGAASVTALQSYFWGAVAVLLSLSIHPVPMDRQMLAFAALYLLLLGIRSRTAVATAAAGAMAGWEVVYSLDYGVFVCAAGLGALVLLPVLEARSMRREMGGPLRDAGVFAAGILAGILPFLADLAAKGSLGEFFVNSFVETPRWATEVWGIPVGRFWDALVAARTVGDLTSLLSGTALPSLFLLLLLGAVGIALLYRSADGSFDDDDRAGWIVFVFAAVAMRGVLGRADAIHYARYGVFAGLPAAWLLRRAWQYRRVGQLLLLPSLLFVLASLHPIRALDQELHRIEDASRLARSPEGAAGPRSGGPILLPNEAAVLTGFRAYVDGHLRPDETFFDFNNFPAFYFVADRLPPIRYCSVAQYESSDRQREVIAALEERKPPLAILPSSDASRFDSIPNAERAPEVFRYLTDNYEPDPEVPWLAWRKGSRRSPGVPP